MGVGGVRVKWGSLEWRSGGVESGGVESLEWRSWEVTNAEFREVLEDRTAKYAVEVFKYLRELPYDVSTKVIAHQLGKSASSIGANYHEANRSESRDDFVHKIAIAVKEANESCYWFKVLRGLCGSNERIEALAKETCELRNLLQSILKSTRSR